MKKFQLRQGRTTQAYLGKVRQGGLTQLQLKFQIAAEKVIAQRVFSTPYKLLTVLIWFYDHSPVGIRALGFGCQIRIFSKQKVNDSSLKRRHGLKMHRALIDSHGARRAFNIIFQILKAVKPVIINIKGKLILLP